jgi:AAA15 family ATPase/GTPase
MLVNFSIQNFGSIKDKQTLSFEADKSKHLEDYYVMNVNGLRLLKLGLIYGANASGKTTILKALDFLRTLVLNPKTQKTETFNFEPFLLDENTPTENTVFEIEFIQNETRYLYEVELNKEAIVREKLDVYNSRKSNVFERTTDFQIKIAKIEFGNKIKISKSAEDALENNTLWNNTVLGGYLKTNVASKELKDLIDWFNGYLSPLVHTLTTLDDFITSQINSSKIKKETLVSILKKADFNISNILIKEKEFEIPKISIILDGKSKSAIHELNKEQKFSVELEFEHTVGNNKYLLPFNNESQGTQRYYGFAGILSLLIGNSIMFSIDELESSLHPDLFQHFLLSFLVNSNKSQLIATTHNREILNNKDIFRNDAIWITDKDNENSATELYSLADFSTNVIRDTTNVFNAYKLGKLGGTPNLGSYYINIDNESE